MEEKSSFQEFKSRKPRPSTEADLVLDIKDTLGKLEKMSINSSIHKVPAKLRQLKPDAYTPRLVSIGPFHHGDQPLQAMEEQKWHYMLHLLHRPSSGPNAGSTAKELAIARSDSCPRAILSLDANVRGCYADNIPLDGFALAEMMVVDGCFILELLLRHWVWRFVRGSDPKPRSDPIFNNAWMVQKLEPDPIFDNAWMVPALRCDLALLENQIPFVVLKKLFDIVKPVTPETFPRSLDELALFFFYPDLESNPIPHKEQCKTEFTHLLDLLHAFHLPNHPPRPPSSSRIAGFKHCGTRLVAGGVRIRKGNDATSRGCLLEIKFAKGDLRIPPLNMDYATESLLRNLIAFEQCSLRGSTHHVTSYAFLLKSLVQSSSDVQFLRKREIIAGDVGGGADQDVLAFFGGLCKEVVQKGFYFSELCDEVNQFHNACWRLRRCKACTQVRCRRYGCALKNDYFSNPWRIISFVAAVVLLLLTGVQTFYTARGYYPH